MQQMGLKIMTLHCTAQYTCSLWHTGDWSSQEGHMSPVWLQFVIISYFLDVPCT